MPERHVFISYSRKDTDMMQRVKQSLEAQNIPCWTDEGITPGTSLWQDAIGNAIENSVCLLVLLSPDAKNSEWVKRELNYAQTHKVQIFSLMVRGNDAMSIPFALIGSQYVDIREDYEAGFNRLLPEVGRLFGSDSDGASAPDFTESQPSSGVWTPLVTQSPSQPQIEVVSEPEPSTERGEIAEQPETPYLEEAVIDGPIEPVTRNQDWTPVIRTINGIEMVLVPPGCFMMGSDDIDDAKPVQRRCIEQAFWIGRYPVTNSQYDTAVKAGIWDEADYTKNEISNDPQHPVVGENWVNASKFAHYGQMRLPTETEWEYAARGPDNWILPWGNNRDSSQNSLTKNPDSKHTSWVGALDMSTDVWEWCLSKWRKNYLLSEDNQARLTSARRVLKGGAFSDAQNLSAASRYPFYPNHWNDHVGFRVVCMAPIAE